jgi:hypothetical protein
MSDDDENTSQLTSSSLASWGKEIEEKYIKDIEKILEKVKRDYERKKEMKRLKMKNELKQIKENRIIKSRTVSPISSSDDFDTDDEETQLE